MSDIIPANLKVPAHILAASEDIDDDLTAGASTGITVLSIKGRQFTIVRGDERTTIMSPKDPDAPAAAINVVILRANRNVSKMYFASQYEEGSAAAPDCFSLDGQKPDPSVESPQAESCATCPHNQWGSRITDSGKKAKACSDHRRIAVAAPNALEDVMLLRVPPKSLKALAEYGRALKARKIDYRHVITQIRFVRDVATPQLEFKVVGFLEPEQVEQVDALYNDDKVLAVIGQPGQGLVEADIGETSSTEKEEDPFANEPEAAEPAPAPKKRGRKPKAAKKPEPVEEAPAAKEPETQEAGEGSDPLGGAVDEEAIKAKLAALFSDD